MAQFIIESVLLNNTGEDLLSVGGSPLPIKNFNTVYGGPDQHWEFYRSTANTKYPGYLACSVSNGNALGVDLFKGDPDDKWTSLGPPQFALPWIIFSRGDDPSSSYPFQMYANSTELLAANAATGTWSAVLSTSKTINPINWNILPLTDSGPAPQLTASGSGGKIAISASNLPAGKYAVTYMGMRSTVDFYANQTSGDPHVFGIETAGSDGTFPPLLDTVPITPAGGTQWVTVILEEVIDQEILGPYHVDRRIAAFAILPASSF